MRSARTHSLGPAGLVVVSLLATACGTSSSVLPSDGPIFLRTEPNPAGPFDRCATTRLGGTLVEDDAFGLVLTGNGNRRGIVWPFGWSARREAGTVLLVDRSRTVVAREGDRIAMAGAVGGDGIGYPCDMPSLQIEASAPPPSA